MTFQISSIWRRSFICILTLFLLCVALPATAANAYTFTPDVPLRSRAAVLYSVDTEQIMFEQNADTEQAPGHLAQIMTAVVVLEQCQDLDRTSITANDTLYGPLYSYDEPDDVRYANIYDGDVLTVREYLYALLLTSSCEAALILADHFGGAGGSENFVSMMNDKAASLGCTNTHFTNPTGLYDAAQVSTARDLLTITTYALQNDDFQEIATTQAFSPTTLNSENHSDPTAWIWTHSNTMMDAYSDYYYEGAAGIKTGNLNVTGRSIITQATRDGNTYLVVLLNAPFEDANGRLQFYHLEDAADLLDWAFSNLYYVTMLEDDEEIGEVEVSLSDGNPYVLARPAEDCIVLWCDGVDTSAVQRETTLVDSVMAPVRAGQQLGTIELKFSGETIASVPLIAVSGVERSLSRYNLYALQNFPHSPLFRYGLIGGGVLSVLYIALCIFAYFRARKMATPETPVHLVPHVKRYLDRPQQNWHRSETVYYHGPDSEEDDERDR